MMHIVCTLNIRSITYDALYSVSTGQYVPLPILHSTVGSHFVYCIRFQVQWTLSPHIKVHYIPYSLYTRFIAFGPFPVQCTIYPQLTGALYSHCTLCPVTKICVHCTVESFLIVHQISSSLYTFLVDHGLLYSIFITIPFPLQIHYITCSLYTRSIIFLVRCLWCIIFRIQCNLDVM